MSNQFISITTNEIIKIYSMSLIGKKISSYTIKSEIDSGGMGTVYLAEHDRMGSMAAIKVLHPSLSLDASLRKRFLSEAKTLSTLNHPMIVRVLDYAEGQDGLYIIMEYVEGKPLDKLIKNVTGPIPEQRAFNIFKKILDGFEYAHSKGIIHRDIKPANIIIDENDNPKIIDFGIVKMLGDASANSMHTTTGTGKGIGTPSFMSPEQVLNKPVDARSDIFSLGLTLFCMITGRTPFGSTLSEFEIKRNIVDLELPRAASIYPNASVKAQHIIDKATAKKPEDRYKSCKEFGEALLASVNAAPTTQVATYQPYEEVKSSNTGYIIAIVAIVVVILAVVLLSLNSGENADDTSSTPTAYDTTVIVEPTTENNNYVSEPTTVDYTPPPIEKSESTSESDNSLSTYEREQLNNTMTAYFREDNRSRDNIDVSKIIDFYDFPVIQYYDKNNVSRSELYDHIYFYYKEKLYYHNLSITNSSVDKNAGFYIVHVWGNYTFETMTKPDRPTRNIHDIYYLNSNYKIVSVESSK